MDKAMKINMHSALALVLTTICAMVFASLCAFRASAQISLLVGTFMSIFVLSVAYPRTGEGMNLRNDLFLLGVVLFFIILVHIFTQLICVGPIKVISTNCFRPTASCFAGAMPGIVVIFGMWIWFRLRHWRQKIKA